MLTVDFDQFPVGPGDRVLDMGCGGGRHAFALYRRGAHVTALDMDAAELKDVAAMFTAMADEGEVPEGATAGAVRGTAYGLPFADATFDRVVCSEVLEHLHEDSRAMRELTRVLKPGGLMAVTVPRWGPELLCWALSSAYHEAEGGHVRIYRGTELTRRLEAVGLRARRGAPHPRAAQPVLVAQVRRRRDGRRQPAGQGLPPAARLGHDEGPEADPLDREAARPGHRQVAGRVPAQALPGRGGGPCRCVTCPGC